MPCSWTFRLFPIFCPYIQYCNVCKCFLTERFLKESLDPLLVLMDIVGERKLNWFPPLPIKFIGWGPINLTNKRKINGSLLTCVLHIRMGTFSDE